MESNKQANLIDHISLNIASLKFFGVWFYIPYSVKTLQFWLIILYRIFVALFVFIIPTSAQSIYVIKLIKSGNAEIQEVASIINLVLTETLATVKLVDMGLRRSLLSQLMDQLISEEFQHHTQVENDILKSAIKVSRMLFIGLLFSCSVDIIVHVIVVPGLNGFEYLPLKMDLIFFDINKPEYFDYAYAYQVLYKPMLLTSFVAMQTLTWAVMSCAISQLDVLIYKFENIKKLVMVTKADRNCDENEAFKMVFKKCVLHHCAIIKFVNTVQRLCNLQLSTTLFMSACIVGTTGVQIFSIDSPLKNITVVMWVFAYLAIFVFILFIDCYFGNSITVKSLHVATIVYFCPWLKISMEMKRSLIIFIGKVQQPIVITAAKLVPISMETFTKVMNWTYKGFAVMNQMKH